MARREVKFLDPVFGPVFGPVVKLVSTYSSCISSIVPCPSRDPQIPLTLSVATLPGFGIYPSSGYSTD